MTKRRVINAGDKIGGFTIVAELPKLACNSDRRFKVLCNNGFHHNKQLHALKPDKECRSIKCVKTMRNAEAVKVLEYVLTKKYGTWQPVKLVKKRTATGNSTFECRCDCGEVRIIVLHLLRCPTTQPTCKLFPKPSQKYIPIARRESWQHKNSPARSDDPGEFAVWYVNNNNDKEEE